MKSVFIVVAVFAFTVPSISYDGIPLTRDISDAPYRSYDETRADYNYGDPYVREERYCSFQKGNKDLVLYVNNDLYPDIQSKLLGEYVSYMESRNWTVVVNTITGGDEVDLRNTVKDDYALIGYFYAIFIGDLPVAWFDVDNDSESGFPCDLFYMDIDGEWRDDVNSDGVFDYHGDGTGDMEADIPMGRWTVSPLTYGGNTEKSLIEHYIDKNLDYRQGGMIHDEGGLAYVDDDWSTWADEWGDAVSGAFYDVLVLSGNNVFESDYESTHLPTSYEHVLACVHSGPDAHYWYDGGGYGLTHNYELYNIQSHSISYNMFACSNTRFTEPNFMGGWYTFMDNDWGVLSIGSTKSGSMLNFEDFYQPLGSGGSYGEAFRTWFEINAEHGAGSDSRGWFYGMSFNGDPTLKTMEYLPVRLSDFYATSDRNGVELSWAFRNDGEDVSFNLFRSETPSLKSLKDVKNREVKLNEVPITGQSPLEYLDGTAFFDTEYEYRLDMIVNGNSTGGLTTRINTIPLTKASFGLAHPYPNPSSSYVNFAYVIPGSSTGEIEVYDISGRRVFYEEIAGGNGVITWEIDNLSRESISHGIYIVRLSDGKEVGVRKFVISK